MSLLDKQSLQVWPADAGHLDVADDTCSVLHVAGQQKFFRLGESENRVAE